MPYMSFSDFTQADTFGHVLDDSGLGKLKMPKVFKRVVKKIEKVAHKVPAVVRKVAPFTSLPAYIATKTKFGQNIVQKVRKAAKTYGPLVLQVGGAVLTMFPPTALIGIALTVGTQGYLKVSAAKKAAKLAEAQGSADAAALDAEAKRLEAETTATVDAFYSQNQAGLAAMGFSPDAWAKMTLEEKIAAMGHVKDAVESKAQLDDAYNNPPENAQSMTAIGYPPEKWATMTSEEKIAAFDKAAAMTPEQWQAAFAIKLPPETTLPDVSISPVEVPVQPPGTAPGAYSVVIEGILYRTFSTPDEAANAAIAATTAGQRFEILFQGQSTGLRIRTGAGVTEVPANMVDQVRALPSDQVKDSVAKAEAKTAGGFPLWLLAIPVAALVAAK